MDELREEIAKSLAGWDGWNWEMMAETEELAGSDEIGKDSYYKMADRIHALYKEAGYVKLAEDQSLPDVWVRDIPSGKLVQEDMWNKGWRKVE